ncbi:MAG: non-hydrolyzing UDP-N-acetylglucosamine 2-epimerase, partial [Waterburya sp.]
MNKPVSVGVILGTRPEAIKLVPVIKQLNHLTQIKTHLILTGQHREMVDRVMELF